MVHGRGRRLQNIVESEKGAKKRDKRAKDNERGFRRKGSGETRLEKRVIGCVIWERAQYTRNKDEIHMEAKGAADEE